MAMLNQNQQRNGIQMGGPLDYCETCANKNNKIDYGALEYKEVFKLYRNGISTCLCMEHFKSILQHYLLVDVNEELTEESLETKEEVKEEVKKDTKKGKDKK